MDEALAFGVGLDDTTKNAAELDRVHDGYAATSILKSMCGRSVRVVPPALRVRAIASSPKESLALLSLICPRNGDSRGRKRQPMQTLESCRNGRDNTRVEIE